MVVFLHGDLYLAYINSSAPTIVHLSLQLTKMRGTRTNTRERTTGIRVE